MNFRGRFLISDRRTHFEHVSAEDLSAILEMIGIVLHERRAAGKPSAHNLNGAHQSCGLPIPFSAKAVSVGHETLHGNSGKLRKAMQVLESVGESVRACVLEEVPQSDLDPGRVR